MIESLSLSEVAKILIPGLLAFFTGRHLALQSRNISSAKDAYTLVYQHLFNLMEPYFYKNPKDTREFQVVLRLGENIIKQHSHLINDDFKWAYEVLITRVNEGRVFDRIQDIVCWSLEKKCFQLKSKLGYPTRRSLSYHIGNASFRRVRAKFLRLDRLAAEIGLVICSVILFVIISTFIYNGMVYIINLLSDLFN